MKFIVYILYSKCKGKYYIGYTGHEISERIRRHNSHHKGFTGGLGDWELMFTENYTTKAQAINRERQIKGWKSKEMIEKLIGA